MSRDFLGAMDAFSCRHCGTTNRRDTPECRGCLRRDWLPDGVEASMLARPDQAGFATFRRGCLTVLALMMIASVLAAVWARTLPGGWMVQGLATAAAALVGLVLFVLLAVMIALFSLCTAAP